MTRHALVLLATAAIMGCGGEQPLTAPDAAVPGAPSGVIADGARGAGNPDFFFLTPLLPDPSGHPNFQAGQFNGSYAPTVQICVLNAAGAIVDANADGLCDAGTVHQQFSGPQIVASITGESYQVNWKTDQPPLLTDKFYRIRVLIGNVELGFADIDPVTRSELKDAQTGATIPLVDGRTLPIKFRIENGVLSSGNGSSTEFVEQVVPATGGTVRTPSKHAGASFPAGWLAGVEIGGQPVTSAIVTIERVPTAANNNCHLDQPAPLGLVQFEGCFRYRTIPDLGINNFAEYVIVAICPEIPESDPRYEALRLYKSDVDEPVTLLESAEVPAALALDCANFAGTAPALASRTILDRLGAGLHVAAAGLGRFLGPRSAFAVDLGAGGRLLGFSNIGLGIERQVRLSAVAPLTAAPVVGTIVPASALVWGRHEHGTSTDTVPLAGQAVTFSAPGGPVPAASATTLGTGLAAFSWTLVPGINDLTATVVGLNDSNGGVTSNVATTTIQLSAGCGAPLGLRSVNSNTAVNYTFTNPIGNPAVNSYWINYDGRLTFYNTIAPGASVAQTTYLTHPWIFQTAAGVCAGGVFDPAGGGTYVIPPIGTTTPTITSLTLASSTVAIGSSTTYTATVFNPTNAAATGLDLQGWITQAPATERAAGGVLLTCTQPLGTLPPGSCTQSFSVNPSNSSAGSGTLIPGAATFRLELRGPNAAVVHSTTVPITLQ